MVVLINSPTLNKRDRSFNNPKMPLGLAYIASLLRSKGIDVQIIDAEAEELTIEKLIERISTLNPKYIGLNCMSLNKKTVAYLSKKIKNHLKNSTIIVGGVHITLSGSNLLKHCDSIDLAIKGEGEYPLLALCSNMKKKEEIPGLIFRDKGKIIDINTSERINDLDCLPFPALDLLPFEIYLRKRRSISIIASRGCPHSCIFCASPELWKKKITYRSASNVIAEVSQYINKFGIYDFHFLDDDFFSWPKSQLNAFLDSARKMKIKWRAIGRIDKITNAELIRQLVDSGCYKLTFGIETGSQRTQTFMGKKIDLSIAPSIIESCHEHGLDTKAYFMYGFPTESLDEMYETLNYSLFLRSKGLNNAVFLPVMAYHGTALFNRYLKSGEQSSDELYEDVYFANDWEESPEIFKDKLRQFSYLPKKSANFNITSKEIRELIRLSYESFYSGQHLYLRYKTKIFEYMGYDNERA